MNDFLEKAALRALERIADAHEELVELNRQLLDVNQKMLNLMSAQQSGHPGVGTEEETLNT